MGDAPALAACPLRALGRLMGQERAVVIDEPPVLVTGNQRRQRSEIGAAAGAEIDDVGGLVAGAGAHGPAELAAPGAAARAEIPRLPPPGPGRGAPPPPARRRRRAQAPPATDRRPTRGS